MKIKEFDKKEVIEHMFSAGVHFGFSKSRRHPSVSGFVFTTKNGVEIFDLEKVADLLANTLTFVKDLTEKGKDILFVASKKEALNIIKKNAKEVEMPYVSGRWIGGTLTNFDEIQKRLKRLADLTEQKEKGLLAKYTKKERLLIDREITKLEERFGGIASLKNKPGAIFVIDTKHEKNAVAEALNENIPIIGLCNSDCNIKDINYPIVANDSSVNSIKFFVEKVVESIKEGRASKK